MPTPLTVRVTRKQTEALDICTFELADVQGAALPAFGAGSHIDVQVPNGLTRQYSLCNDPLERHRYVIGVLRDPASRGGSTALHDHVNEGDVLRISAPRNHFPLTQHAQRSLLLAGGIGITPILCMAEMLAQTGAPFELHYCTRSRERTASEGLHRFRARHRTRARLAGSTAALRVLHVRGSDADRVGELRGAARALPSRRRRAG